MKKIGDLKACLQVMKSLHLTKNKTSFRSCSMTSGTKQSTMTKKKLINTISQERGIHPNDVRHVIQAFLDKMIDSLSSGERLEFRDFGVFEVVLRKQKVGRNP